MFVLRLNYSTNGLFTQIPPPLTPPPKEEGKLIPNTTKIPPLLWRGGQGERSKQHF